MKAQKQAPQHKLGQSVKCFGYSTAQSKRPLWFTVWDNKGVQGHADTVELVGVNFTLDKAAQAKSRGTKLDGTPSATTLKKREKTGNQDIYDCRKAPFLFVNGTAVAFNGEADTTDAVQIRPCIDRKIGGKDAHFCTLDGRQVTRCDRILLTVTGIWAWGVQCS